MEESSVNKAVAHLIINTLKGNKEFELYENPTEEFTKICKDLKSKLRNYFTDPQDLLKCTDENVEGEIIRRLSDNDWDHSDKEKELEELAKKIDPEKEEVYEELINSGDIRFAKRLLSMNKKDRKKKIDDWLDREGVLDQLSRQVYERSQRRKIIDILVKIAPSTVNKDYLNFLLTNLATDEFLNSDPTKQQIGRFYTKNKYGEERLLKALYEYYEDNKMVPKLWLDTGGKGAPSTKWLKQIFVPYLRKGNYKGLRNASDEIILWKYTTDKKYLDPHNFRENYLNEKE